MPQGNHCQCWENSGISPLSALTGVVTSLGRAGTSSGVDAWEERRHIELVEPDVGAEGEAGSSAAAALRGVSTPCREERPKVGYKRRGFFIFFGMPVALVPWLKHQS
ncbi:hypothetical protein B0H17DRAFT_1182886 [Mycena rosella]|uniref:Uncharacterized protein n=1 Tax=Mycena rosella TaxID=1033263 RepID=A0AAD7D296_MYCRO|nr:hypothetical protein B0H17DRAFT_1182886 [Mycena rosella]